MYTHKSSPPIYPMAGSMKGSQEMLRLLWHACRGRISHEFWHSGRGSKEQQNSLTLSEMFYFQGKCYMLTTSSGK